LVVGELFEADDKVVAHFNWEVHGRTSGIETKLDVTSLNTVIDGQIVRQRYYFDHAEALKAVGLEE
jgi:ketosteroid isomerase-like protein